MIPRTKTFGKYLHRALNVGILLACVLLVMGLAQRYNLSKQAPGRTISVSGVDFSQSKKTLLLFLQQDCEICLQSMPFYLTLTDRFQDPKNVNLVLITPNEPEVTGKFFRAAGLSFQTVLKGDRGLLGVKLTPTLILADSTGTVRGLWIGALSPEREKELWTMLDR